MSKRKSNKKNKKELVFLEPIDSSMTVDEIYLKLIEIFKKKGIKIYPDKKDINWVVSSTGVTFSKTLLPFHTIKTNHLTMRYY